MDKKLLEMTQDQIQMEYFSAYLYMSMTDWLERNDYPGAANWMRIQYQEEIQHAEGFIKILQRVGEPIKLRAIEQPKHEFKDIEEVFKGALEHEQLVSESIRKMMSQAHKADEWEMVEFIKWYIMEQVEEEENAEENLANVRRVKDNPAGMKQLDDLWAARTYVKEVIPYTGEGEE